jgi:enamine deaminase RidA (YjgF/YER057c/UK114 family)
MTEFLNPPGIPDASRNSASQVVVVPPGHKMIFVAGKVGENAAGEVVSSDFQEQARQAFENVRIALQGAGATPADIVKVTVYIVGYEVARVHAYAAEHKLFFGARGPATTVIGVDKLVLPSMLFEIDVIAAVPG